MKKTQTDMTRLGIPAHLPQTFSQLVQPMVEGIDGEARESGVGVWLDRDRSWMVTEMLARLARVADGGEFGGTPPDMVAALFDESEATTMPTTYTYTPKPEFHAGWPAAFVMIAFIVIACL